ncbi:MAG: NAD-dependent epimerase/dehydratase family protein [Bacteroidetes bacterium]|nr:MAG: NAD-dependent epimerase/dehydratase family protein [Bacteroidota bacterium]
MKKAIVVGHTGQDGYYLSEQLREKKYEILGVSTKQITPNPYGIGIVDVMDSSLVASLLLKFKPDEIYFLAAVHQSSSDRQIEDGALFQKSLDLNVKGLVNFLEGMRRHVPDSKLFYAASSHVFGNPSAYPQDENTPLCPDCIYGITKTAGIGACHFYRENHNIFACVGIFYNHESPLRASKFVSKKIVEGAIAIKKQLSTELVLGDLESRIDWGYAPDYMKAVFAVMQLKKPDDFIISSGSQHTIKDFVEGVFSYLSLDWKEYVKINPGLITKKQKKNLLGNSQKVRKATGWLPDLDFSDLIKKLVDEELKKHASV